MNTHAKRIGSGAFGAAVVYAAIHALMATPTPTQADVHAELAEYVRTVKLPSKVDDITTMTAVRLDGDVITYTYDVKGITKADFEAYHDSSQADRTEKVCGNSLTRKVIDAGIAVHSEYRNSGAALGETVVSSCPVKAAAADHKDPFDGPLAYSYDLVGGRIIIHAKGNVGIYEPTALTAWWSALPKNAADHMKVGMITLALDSPGGSVMGAAHLSQWVKDNKVDTVVPNGAQCASACVLIWGAGEHKFAGESAQIGVHNARTDDDKTAVAAEATVFTARALADEKAPSAVIAAATTTPSSDVHWLTAADIVAWGATILDENGQPLAESHCTIKGADVMVSINRGTHDARLSVPSGKDQVEGKGRYTDEPNGDKRITFEDTVVLVSESPDKSAFTVGGNPPVTFNTTCSEFKPVG